MDGPRYRAYVSSVSYYSGKLEAYLRHAGIPHERIEINSRILHEELLPATGVMKVPAMRTPDGRWLKDTTPMIEWLDREHGAPSIYPQDPAAGFLARLVEDYADEWLWRPAMYYRWNFADSHRLLRHRLGRELSAGTRYPAALLGWFMRWRQYLIYVRGDGVRRHNEAAVQALYARTLAQLSALLKTRPFLLGARPSIVDFGYFASMFRHFALDPHSAQILINTAPAVFAWVGRVWDARAEADPTAPLEDFDDPAWSPVFAEIGRDYRVYLDANAETWQRGQRRFDLALADARYPRLPVVRYRVACREQLLRRFRALPPAAAARVQARLAEHGLGAWLAQAATIPSGLDEEFVMPLRQRYPAAGLPQLLGGTPWDQPAAPLAPDDPPPR